MFDESMPSRDELLKNMSTEVERIKSQLDKVESDMNSGNYDLVTIITSTNRLTEISRVIEIKLESHLT